MSFKQIRKQDLPGLAARFEEYEHPTGMRHIHVARDDVERGFMLVFPTPPADDKGIPHILEHLVLSGSESFPTRDPFFSMLKRSTASFINAMTAKSFTMFPFAAVNESDYWNLASVYCDATFFPNLHRLDFMQEGWRDTLDEEGNLSISGVVYNEMIGALNSRDRRLEMEIDRHWFPGHSAAFISGGEPLAIPSLSYQELVDYHATHYHPSRAILMTYGDFPASQAQEKIEQLVLSRRKWEALPPIEREPRVVPSGVSASVPVPQESDGNEHSVTWLWDVPAATVFDRVTLSAMNNLLFQSGSPFISTIETSGFCRLGHVELGAHEGHGVFRVDLHGLAEQDLGRAKELLDQALANALANPPSAEEIQSTMRNFEFSQRTAGGKIVGLPFCLGKFYQAANLMNAGLDGLSAFDVSNELERLRELFDTPESIKRWMETNMTRPADLVLHGRPDPDFSQRYAQKLADIAKQHQEALTPEDVGRIRKDAIALEERQSAPVNLDVLPGLTVADLPRDPQPELPVEFVAGTENTPAQIGVQIPTNGQAYLTIALEISAIDPDLFHWTKLLVDLASHLGAGEKDWQEAMRQRNLDAVMISSSVRMFGDLQYPDRMGLEATFNGAGLVSDIPSMTRSLAGMIKDVRVDEMERISQLLRDMLAEERQSLSSNGNNWAKTLVSSSVSGRQWLVDMSTGREAHEWRSRLEGMLDNENGRQQIKDKLSQAREALLSCPMVICVAGEDIEALAKPALREFAGWKGWEKIQGQQSFPVAPRPMEDVALVGKTSVNYAHRAWPAPTMIEEGSGYYNVLSRLLSQGYLHGAVREKGGAYGSSATASNGVFSMMSYRDPRFAKTHEDFDRALEWVASGKVGQDEVNAAIIATCRSLDAPSSLVEAAERALSTARAGMKIEHERRYRNEVLSSTPQDMQRLARQLLATPSVRGGFIGEAVAEEARGVGISVEPIVRQPSIRKPGTRMG